MLRLEISREADADLDDILDYGIPQHGEAAAEAYVAGFSDVFAFLQQTPFAGQIDEDTAQGLRRWRYRQHKVFYQVSDHELLIVRVLHQQAHVSDRLG